MRGREGKGKHGKSRGWRGREGRRREWKGFIAPLRAKY